MPNDINDFLNNADTPLSSLGKRNSNANRKTTPIGISLTEDSLDQIDFITDAMIENRKGEPNRTELMRFGIFAISEMLSDENLSDEALRLWDKYDADYRKKRKGTGR